MIRIKEFTRSGNEPNVTLFADTKAEVPATGAETKLLIEQWPEDMDLPIASALYTPDFDIAILKSDDTWKWS